MRGLVYACCFIIFLLGASNDCSASAGGESHSENKPTSKEYPEITAWHKLAGKYFAERLDDKGDSLVDKQIIFAEQHNDMVLMREVLFGNPRFELLGNISRTHKNIVTTEASQKTVEAIIRALDFAKAKRNNEDVALAYKLLSAFYIAQGSFSEASRYANLAYTTALHTKNDSVKVICGLQLGYTFVQEMNVLMAFKTFTTALDIATEKNNPALLQKVYLHFADMYRKLGKKEDAKAWALRSLTMNEKNQDHEALIDDYLFLGKLHDYKIGLEYLNKALKLAEQEDELFAKIEIEKSIFLYHVVISGSTISIQFLNNHPYIQQAYNRTGPFYLDWILADIYLYSNKPDSAHYYFLSAENAFSLYYNKESQKSFYSEFADCYYLLDSTDAAISNYEKVFRLCTATSDFPLLIDVLGRLKELHHRKQAYEQAYQYSQLVLQYKDSVHQMANEKEVALHEIENLEKEKLNAQKLQKIEEERRHNLQYMAITISIIVIFLVLIYLGLFSVSKTMIRILGFFSFIFFFEFIILLADHKIHHMMHGEPLYIWLIKVALLSVLLPLHHWMEEKVVHYLVSRKLIVLKEQVSFKNLFNKLLGRKKGGTPAPPLE